MITKICVLLLDWVSWCWSMEYRLFSSSCVYSWFQLALLWSCKWANVCWQDHLVFWVSWLPHYTALGFPPGHHIAQYKGTEWSLPVVTYYMSSKCLRIVLVFFTYKLTEAFISFSGMSAEFLENSENQTQMNKVKFKPLKIGVFFLNTSP